MNRSIAWSNSRIQLLRECPYKYYLYYILSDNGWLNNASKEAKSAYIFKKMTNLPMFVGNVVHNTIQKIINGQKRTNRLRPLEETKIDNINDFINGVNQSINKHWKINPTKSINLYEHYYGDGISDDQIEICKSKIHTCISSFYSCDICSVLQTLSNEDYLTLEEFQKFRFNTGEEVIVKIDFGFRKDDFVYLVDWKTGKPNNRVIEQLITYAMFALKQKWINRLENICIIPAYLLANQYDKLSIDMSLIRQQAETIRQEYSILTKVDENRNNSSYFVKTNNKIQCEKCFFKEICYA